MNKPRAIGDIVRSERFRLGLSQKTLADRCGMTQASISRIESGVVTQLQAETLRRLSEVLCISVDYLVGRKENLDPPEVLKSDPLANDIFRRYMRFSERSRTDLWMFSDYLDAKEKDDEKKMKRR